MNFYKIILFFLLSLNSLMSDNLKITTNEWYPYTSKHTNGFISEIIKEIFKTMEVSFTINYQNFEQGYLDVLNNRYDATYPYFITNERKNNVLYTEPIYTTENVLFFNKNTFNHKKNIYNHTIGLVKGYAYKNIDISKFKNKTIIPSELVAFDMLDQGKIDLLPSNKLVGVHLIKRYFNDFYSNIDYLKNKQYITTDDLYVIFTNNPKNKTIINKFNNALKKIKTEGIYDEIIIKNRQLIYADLSNVITLVNNTESFPMVFASEKVDSNENYIIPRGTKAVVLEWSPHFKTKAVLKVYDEMFKKTKIKIINGPLKGKVLFVANMYIEIN